MVDEEGLLVVSWISVSFVSCFPVEMQSSRYLLRGRGESGRLVKIWELLEPM